MDRPSPVALVRFAKATALTVVLGVCMSLLPLGLPVFAPFLALPIAYLVVRGDLWQGLALAVVVGILVWFLAGLGTAALIVLLLLGLGMVLGEALRRRWSFGRALAVVASGALVALLLWGVLLWQLGLSLSDLRESAFSSIDRAVEMYAGVGVPAATTELASDQLRRLIDMMPYLVPGLLGMGVILLAASCIGLAYAFFPRLRDKVEVQVALSGFRMHWSTAYVSIAGLAMLVLSRGEALWHSVMLYAGIDLLLISQTLFFLQGLAIVHWYARTRQVPSGAKSALYVAAVFGQAFLQLTGLLGLFDTWLDCRRRFALKSPRPGPSR
jgi:uncharacterized protein YybS (DUF2232 family)